MKEWGKFKKAEEDFTIDDELEQISLENGLEPFVLHNGTLGIHFMHMGYSAEYERTIEEELDEHIDASKGSGGEIDEESRKEFLEYREILTRMIKKIDDALQERDANEQGYR